MKKEKMQKLIWNAYNLYEKCGVYELEKDYLEKLLKDLFED